MGSLVAEFAEIAQFLVMVTAALLLWTHRHAFLGGSLYQKFQRMEKDIEDVQERIIASRAYLDKRLDKAGEDQSEFAGKIQPLFELPYQMRALERNVETLEGRVAIVEQRNHRGR